MSPSRRASRSGNRRDDADSNERGGRSGRGERGGRRSRSSSSLGASLLVGFVIFLVLAGIGLFVWSHNLKTMQANDDGMRAAYADWIKQCQDGLSGKAGSIATGLKPIYEDVPTEKTPDVIPKLAEKYGPTLNGTGANYAWCQKSWNIGTTAYSANISPGNAQKFLRTPANCAPLDSMGSVNIPNINGLPMQTGSISLFYDMDERQPVAILQLNLGPAPPPAPAEGQPLPPKPVPPTMFILWYTMPAPSSSGKAYLDKMLSSAR